MRLTLPTPQSEPKRETGSEKDAPAEVQESGPTAEAEQLADELRTILPPEPAEVRESGPTAEQLADEPITTVPPAEPAEVAVCLTRQEWEAEQDMRELGRHLCDSHAVFQQRCDTFHMFLEWASNLQPEACSLPVKPRPCFFRILQSRQI